MILVDFSAIAFSQLVNGNLVLQEDLIRHTILNNLRAINVKHRHNYGQMVLACDGGSWREQVFPEYKWLRKQSRVQTAPTPVDTVDDLDAPVGMDWAEAFRILNTLVEELSEYGQWPVVRVQGAEGDDVIALLRKYHLQTAPPFVDRKVLIVSRDRDFMQLHDTDTHQWDPMTEKFMKPDKNPDYELFVKCVKGDGGDGIPNILSPQDFYKQKYYSTTPMRQPSVSTKKLEEWWKNGIPSELEDRYKLNKSVIDLQQNLMPFEIGQKIFDTFNAQCAKGNDRFLTYLISKNCRNLIERLTDFEPGDEK